MAEANWYIGIPTYKRVNLKTLKLLDSVGFPKERIIISTQRKEDYDILTEKYRGYHFIFNTANSAGTNRNNILSYAEAHKIDRILFMDDDVSSIRIKHGKTTSKCLDIEGIVDFMFDFCAKNAGVIFGIYPLPAGCMQKGVVTMNTKCDSQVMGVLDTSIRFDPLLRVKQDYELCCKIISNGGRVFRFDFVSCYADSRTQGGCYDFWKANGGEANAYSCELLISKYPSLIARHHTRKNEVRFIGKTEKIQIL